MADTVSSPSHSHHQEDDKEHLLNKDPNPNQLQEPKNSPPPPQQQQPHSETLETLDLPNQPQLPPKDQEIQNPQPPEEEQNLMVLDGDDQQSEEEDQKTDLQSGTKNATLSEPIVLTDDINDRSPPPPAPPITSPTNPHRRPPMKRKKAMKRRKSTKRVQNLIDNLKPVPFVPNKKALAFDKHTEVLKRLGLLEFSKIEFDRSVRTDLVAQLIVNYDIKKRCSYVDTYRINVNRAVLARALKLPASKHEKGGSSSSNVEEVDLDSEVFSDDAIVFIEDFVANWMLLHEGSWTVPTEIVNWTRCIKDGHPEKMDSASLVWHMVEKELNQRDKLVNCYYASHLQQLIKSQRSEIFEQEMEEVEEVKDDDDGEENIKAEEKEEKEDKEEKDDKEEKEENEEKEEKVLVVEEHTIELTLGPEVEEIVHEEVTKDGELTLMTEVEVTKDDELMIDAEECKEVEEEVEVEEQEQEQGNWLLGGKNDLGEHFLQRCQSSDLNGYEERKLENNVDDELIEQVDDEEEDEEEEQRVEDGFDMEANDDSLDRDGLTDNFLQGVEASHIPFGSQAELRGMSSMDLFGSRDGSFMAHGGPSFFGNGGKRVMEEPEEEDIHHLDGNNKRLKTDEMWDPKQNDFGFCLEQMQQWMEKAKIVYETKEQSYENSQYSQQLAMNQLQERHTMMEMYIKSKDEELEKKHAEVFRLERELFLMGDLLAGYRKALNDTRFKFSEYRKRHALQEEPLYKDAGPGGLVLSTRELERQRLKQEEDRARFVMLAKALEAEFVYKMGTHHDKVSMMADKLVSIEDEVKKLKEIATQQKETRKLSVKPEEIVKPRDEQEVSVEPEENPKGGDEHEVSAEPEETLKSPDEQKLSAEPEENQKPVDERELSEENQKPVDERELSVEHEENQKSVDDVELSAEPEENQKSRDEVRENDTVMEESVSPDADAPKEKGDGED